MSILEEPQRTLRPLRGAEWAQASLSLSLLITTRITTTESCCRPSQELASRGRCRRIFRSQVLTGQSGQPTQTRRPIHQQATFRQPRWCFPEKAMAQTYWHQDIMGSQKACLQMPTSGLPHARGLPIWGWERSTCHLLLLSWIMRNRGPTFG